MKRWESDEGTPGGSEWVYRAKRCHIIRSARREGLNSEDTSLISMTGVRKRTSGWTIAHQTSHGIVP